MIFNVRKKLYFFFRTGPLPRAASCVISRAARTPPWLRLPYNLGSGLSLAIAHSLMEVTSICNSTKEKLIKREDFDSSD